jgi:hypothetical protein
MKINMQSQKFILMFEREKMLLSWKGIVEW